MKTSKRIVIAGGPGGGKSTSIILLRELGYCCFDEVSRQHIQDGKINGFSNFYQAHPLEFSRLLWEARIKQYQSIHQNKKSQWYFYDRALPDTTTYLRFDGHPKLDWEDQLKLFPYDLVFLLSPDKSMYTQDNERLESFERAMALHQLLTQVYKNLFPCIEIPFDTPENRIENILTHCRAKFLS